MDRIYQIHDISADSKMIRKIEDLSEVKSMLEANTKKWENAVLEKGIEKGIDIGIEKGIEKGIMKRDVEITEKMIANNMSNEDIRKITGMSLSKINALRKNLKR